MQKLRLLHAAAACAALITLAACNREPDVVNVGPPDAQKEALKTATPKELPPSISASRIYRCKDNSLVKVDFMSDQKTAILRAPQDSSPVVLNAPEAGQPFVAGDVSVTGSGRTITAKVPGKGAQECKA